MPPPLPLVDTAAPRTLNAANATVMAQPSQVTAAHNLFAFAFVFVSGDNTSAKPHRSRTR